MYSPPAIDIAALINAVGSASARSRLILLTIVVASVLAFAATWKSRPSNWLNSRAAAAGAAVEYVAYATKQAKVAVLDTFETIKPDARLSEEKKQRLERGRVIAEMRGLRDVDHAREYRRETERLRLDNVALVRIPVFGVTFDVNDSGMLAGLAFVVLLMLQRIALTRECDCLESLGLLLANHPERRNAYALLSMTQVLTFPDRITPGEEHQRPPGGFWKHITKILIWIPVAVHLGLFANDIDTIQIGLAMNQRDTVIAILLSFAAIFIMVILAWQSTGLLVQLDHEFRRIELAAATGD